MPMKGLTYWVRFTGGPALPVEVLSSEGLKVELVCELLRLSAATTPKSKASTSTARMTAPRRPILRDNLPGYKPPLRYIILDSSSSQTRRRVSTVVPATPTPFGAGRGHAPEGLLALTPCGAGDTPSREAHSTRCNRVFHAKPPRTCGSGHAKLASLRPQHLNGNTG